MMREAAGPWLDLAWLLYGLEHSFYLLLTVNPSMWWFGGELQTS